MLSNFKQILFVVALVICQNSWSQDQTLQTYQYSVKDGLPSNTIYDILFSKQGAVFFATGEGVVRYNGVAFKLIEHEGIGRSISRVVEGKDGEIWALSFYGDIIRIVGDEAKIVNKWDVSFRISDIEFVDQLIITAQRNGIYTLDEDYNFKKVEYSLSELYWVYDIFDGKENKILFTQEKNGYSVHDIISHKSTFYEIENNTAHQRLFEIGGKLASFTFKRELLFFEDGEVTYSEYFKPEKENKKVHRVQAINDTLFGVSDYKGFSIYSLSGTRHFYTVQDIPVFCSAIDTNGQIWLGTAQDGIYVIPSLNVENNDFSKYLLENEKLYSSDRDSANNLYCGTYAGRVLKFDPSGKMKSVINLEKEAEVQAIHYNHQTNRVFAYCDLLYEMDAETLEIVKTYDETSTKDIYVEDGIILIGTFSGLNKFVGKRKLPLSSQVWTHHLEKNHKTGKIWVGTKKGLFYLNSIKDNSLKPFPLDEDSTKIFSISAIKVDTEGNVFVVTLNNGVYKITGDHIVKIIDNEKLPKGTKRLAILDNQLAIWGHNEMHLFHLEKDSSYVIDETKGLLSEQVIQLFNINGCLEALYLRGLQRFTDLPKKNTVQPSISMINAIGNYVKKDDRYWMNYNNNGLTFQLEAHPNFKSLGNNTIYYRWKGEEKWMQVAKNNGLYELSFNYLTPGQKTLQLQAFNEDGVASEIIEIEIEIDFPFWQKTWFIVLVLGVMIFIFYLIYRWRLSIIKRKAEQRIEQEKMKRRTVAAELTSLRSQMNPHFIFNALTSIQSKVLSGEKESAYNNINEFSVLMRRVLDQSKFEFISLEEELEMMRYYLSLEKDRFGNEFQYEFIIDERIDERESQVPTLIMQPFIENAIIHGLQHKKGPKALQINIIKNLNNLTIEILDNGIGRKASAEINKKRKKHKSFAIDAIKNRINRINQIGKFELSYAIEDLEQGTKVIIQIQNNEDD